MNTVEIVIEGMSCQHCVGSVEKAIKELDGIQNIKVNLQNKKAVVEFNESKVDIDRIKKAVKECGYDPA